MNLEEREEVKDVGGVRGEWGRETERKRLEIWTMNIPIQKLSCRAESTDFWFPNPLFC